MASKKLKVKLILPSLTEAHSQYWRSIKYSLFPPLGIATLAGYFNADDEVEIIDEHVEILSTDDTPDLVVLQVYITSAYRAYEIADEYRRKNVYVVMGGLHVTALPDEVQKHADTIFIGPSEYSWKEFIDDFRQKKPKNIYNSIRRDLDIIPHPRRDLIKNDRYLVPNSMVVSRGCQYNCDFCYKNSFFRGGKSFYTQKIDRVLAEIDSFKGKHIFFLDDNIFSDKDYALSLFDALKGMGKLWQSAGTVKSILDDALLKNAVDSGLRSLFVGFETLNRENLQSVNKKQNKTQDYEIVIKKLHDNGVMINSSFVFGMDHDTEDTFRQTTDWAIQNSIETATFHILTPYPGTKLYEILVAQKRILTSNWNLYDTRHSVFLPKNMTPETLENGYWTAYDSFYKWSSIFKSALNKEKLRKKLRHLIYTSGWKKFEFLWYFLIKTNRLHNMIPVLESLLNIPSKSLNNHNRT